MLVAAVALLLLSYSAALRAQSFPLGGETMLMMKRGGSGHRDIAIYAMKRAPFGSAAAKAAFAASDPDELTGKADMATTSARCLASVAAKVMKGPRRTLPSKAALSMTPAAVNQVKLLLSRQPEAPALRVGVRTRGCNGMTYTLDYAQAKGKLDEVVEQDGAVIYIDAKAQLTLLGTEMDFVTGELATEFVFRNPNIKGTCGCGESFNM